MQYQVYITLSSYYYIRFKKVYSTIKFQQAERKIYCSEPLIDLAMNLAVHKRSYINKNALITISFVVQDLASLVAILNSLFYHKIHIFSISHVISESSVAGSKSKIVRTKKKI